METNPDFLFNGLKLKDWIESSGMKYKEYIDNIVKKMGMQASDSILSVAPIMLRVNIKVWCVDTENSVYLNRIKMLLSIILAYMKTFIVKV